MASGVSDADIEKAVNEVCQYASNEFTEDFFRQILSRVKNDLETKGATPDQLKLLNDRIASALKGVRFRHQSDD